MTVCEQVLHLGVRTTLQGVSEVSRNANAGENVKAARLPLFSFSAHPHLASPFACHSRMTSNDIPN